MVKKFEWESWSVALIVDTCPVHPNIKGLNAARLAFRPPNTTSKTQPMDQGVIRSLKAKYRGKIIQRLTQKVFPATSILDVMKLSQPSCSDIAETTVKNCFPKLWNFRGGSKGSDPFKDLSSNELENTINELHVPAELNAAVLLDIDTELSTSGGKVSDSGIFAEARVQIVNIEEANDALEVEDESLVCPTSLEVDKALEVHQQLTLFCEIGKEMREVVKVNTYAQREIMKKKNFNHSFNKL